MSPELSFPTIAVLGLGVMGGSLAKALSARRPDTTIVGWSPAVGERDDALELGILSAAPAAWEEAVEEASLVVLAMPLDACRAMILAMDGVAPSRATVMDVASLKAPVARAVEAGGLRDRWVGAHPMAGSEGSGFGRSSENLFAGARVWLVAGEVGRDRIAAVSELWRDVGGSPREIDAEEHDRLMGLVSHLPQLLANALGAELARRSVTPPDLGPGGRDMTRLAASNPEMWHDLLRYPSRDLIESLRGVSDTAGQIASALERADVDAVARLMRETMTWRAGG